LFLSARNLVDNNAPRARPAINQGVENKQTKAKDRLLVFARLEFD